MCKCACACVCVCMCVCVCVYVCVCVEHALYNTEGQSVSLVRFTFLLDSLSSLTLSCVILPLWSVRTLLMNAVLLLISPLIPQFVRAQYKSCCPAMWRKDVSADSRDRVLWLGPANWVLMIQVSFLERCSLPPGEIKMWCPLWKTGDVKLP